MNIMFQTCIKLPIPILIYRDAAVIEYTLRISYLSLFSYMWFVWYVFNTFVHIQAGASR